MKLDVLGAGIVVLITYMGSIYLDVPGLILKKSAKSEPTTKESAICKTRQITVPVIANAAMSGYLVFQFSVECANVGSKKEVDVTLESYLIDETYRYVYPKAHEMANRLDKIDISELSRVLSERVGERLPRVKPASIRLSEFVFIPRSEVR